PSAAGILGAMRQQTLRALDEADLVVFVVDAREDMTPVDTEVAKLLRKTDKPVLVAANKVDSEKAEAGTAEAFALGFEQVFGLSPRHGRGGWALLDARVAKLPKRAAAAAKAAAAAEAEAEADADADAPLRLAFVGKPNVGKSSLVNCLLGEERVLV